MYREKHRVLQSGRGEPASYGDGKVAASGERCLQKESGIAEAESGKYFRKEGVHK